MAEATVTIKYGTTESSFQIRSGLGLQALAGRQQLPLEFDCREADCGICIMSVLKGAEHLSPHTVPEKDFLQAMHADPNERLACQTRVFGDITIKVEEP